MDKTAKDLPDLVEKIAVGCINPHRGSIEVPRVRVSLGWNGHVCCGYGEPLAHGETPDIETDLPFILGEYPLTDFVMALVEHGTSFTMRTGDFPPSWMLRWKLEQVSAAAA